MINAKYFYFRLNETHHLYYGILILLFGWYFDYEWIRTVGWIVLVDDVGQHILQGYLNKNYRSPLHYITLFFEPLRKLVGK